MKLNNYQREQLENYLSNCFTRAGSSEVMREIESILEFEAENSQQAELFRLGMQYEYVLKNFHQTERKISAIKFLRQLSSTSGMCLTTLYDTKHVVDHFWAGFDKEPTQ